MRYPPFLVAVLLAGLAIACGGDDDTDAAHRHWQHDASAASDAKNDASDANEEPSDATEVPSDASEVPSDASDGGDTQAECVEGSVVCEGDILVKCPNGERVETDCAATGQICHAQMRHCM